MRAVLLTLLFNVAVFANIGTVMAISGNAEVIRDAKALKVSNGMDIKEGDEIVTKLKTKVQVMLKDDTTITIGPKSSFSFLDYSFDATNNSKLTMKSTKGYFRAVTGKIGKLAPERFKVKTNLATIGVRGTDFSALLRDNYSFYKCHSGEITLSFEDKVQSITAGNQIQLQSNNGIIQEKIEQPSINNTPIQNSATFESVRIEDITDKTQDIQDIKFNCQ